MVMEMESNLPSSVQEIADVIGRQNALTLVGRVNNSFYVPKPEKIVEEHWIAQTIGLEAALILSNEFRGLILKVANCRSIYRVFRNRTFCRLWDEGWSKSEIAQCFRITERHVNNILKQAPTIE